jgi:hypothetical protein
MRVRISIVLVVGSVTACGGSTTDSTSSGGGSGAGATGGSGGIPAGGGASATGGGSGAGGGSATGGTGGGVVEPGPFTGTWKGYVENYTFSDNTDVVTIFLDAVQSQVAGHVMFGDSAPLPPPTDPNVGYPPGAISGGPAPDIKATPGFYYTIVNGSFDGERLKFDVSLNELVKQWCEMQAPIVDDVNAGMYHCTPNWSGGSIDGKCFLDNPDTGQKDFYDCAKVALCMFTCQCTAQSCSVDLNGGPTFDMQLVPPNADGSVDGLGGLHNVHLKHL